MERARHRQRHHSFRAEFLGDDTGLVDRFGRTRDHDLSGAVVVGDPDIVGDAATRDLDVVIVEAEDRGHRSFAFFGRNLHGLAAFGDESHGVGKVDGARCGERGVLAQTVPRVAGGLDTDAGHGVENDHRQHKCGELRVARLFEVLGIGPQQQVLDIATSGLGCL